MEMFSGRESRKNMMLGVEIEHIDGSILVFLHKKLFPPWA